MPQRTGWRLEYWALCLIVFAAGFGTRALLDGEKLRAERVPHPVELDSQR